jgi:hypothetical protein
MVVTLVLSWVYACFLVVSDIHVNWPMSCCIALSMAFTIFRVRSLPAGPKVLST